MSDPSAPDDDGSSEAAARPRPPTALLRDRLNRRAAQRPVSGRGRALVAVVVVVAVMGAVAAVFAPNGAAPAAGSFDAIAVPPAGSYSSSAFCASGTGTAAAVTIFLTNSSDSTVNGTMTTVGVSSAGDAVATSRRSVSVPGRGSAAVDPSQGLPAGSTASTFVFAGGGVVATQVVAGPTGWSTAPCATQTSSEWSFAGGSTTSGQSVQLTLFNPTSTGAVVNVSFVTDHGRVTPQSYQGLVVPAGRQVVESIGDFVQNDSSIATLVTAQAGMVVSDEFQQWSSGASTGLSLQLGAPALSRVWRFAQTTDSTGSTVSFTLANPTTAEVTASIAFGLSSGSVVPRHVPIPPLATVAFTASTAAGLPKQVPFSVVVTAPVPIVVGRSVLAPAAAPAPVWGASAATVTAADHWLVPGPGVPGAPGIAGATVDSLAVANPGRTATRVSVSTLDGSRPQRDFTVGPDSVAVLGPTQLKGLAAVEVRASSPVNVEEDSGPSGAPGVVSSSGFPLPS